MCHSVRPMTDSVYETDRILREYLLFHYGGDKEVLPYSFGPREALGFPVRTVAECIDRDSIRAHARALDLGCSVGRSTFELARHCREVIGVDVSIAFIGAARTLRDRGSLSYRRTIVGEVADSCRAEVPHDIERTRVRFEVLDVHEIPDAYGTFDVVHAANLLCRMRNPQRLLDRLPDLVEGGGQLILATPNTWLEDFTPREHWIGGTVESGDPLEALKSRLEGAFRFQEQRDIPFLIREHERKYQWSVAQASTWRRRSG